MDERQEEKIITVLKNVLFCFQSIKNITRNCTENSSYYDGLPEDGGELQENRTNGTILVREPYETTTRIINCMVLLANS